MRARQSHGELPQCGDVEPGHLFAAIASARRFFAESDATVVDRLAESNGRLREAAVAAKDNGPAAAEEDLIRRFIDSCDSFDATLRKHSPARTT